MDYLYFKGEVRELAGSVEPADQTISPEAQRLAAFMFAAIDDKYGKNSNSPNTHHNADHELNVAERSIEFANILYSYIPDEDKPGLYDALVLAAAAHDYEQDLGPGDNERASAKFLIDTVLSSEDPEISEPYFANRLFDLVMVTEVAFGEDNNIEQTNLHAGSTDTAKFIFAFADINGIAMEGKDRMITDATNIFLELYKNPTVESYKNFFMSQIPFLRRRLNDWRITSDIERYFPQFDEEVYLIMEDNFHLNIITAYDFAKEISELKNIEDILGDILKTSNPLYIAKVAVEKLSKIIH